MPLNPHRRPGELVERLDVRLSPNMRERLERAIAITPGVASCAGVVRIAVDRYLNEVLADSTA
jgi:predicted DNA-binding protein